jgi:hypothetical protein
MTVDFTCMSFPDDPFNIGTSNFGIENYLTIRNSQDRTGGNTIVSGTPFPTFMEERKRSSFLFGTQETLLKIHK